MPFAAVTNLASAEAADAERKRRTQQAQLAADADRLKNHEADQLASEATGPAAVLAQLQKGNRVAVDPDVIRNAEQDQFLNSQAHRRFDRQGDRLAEQARQAAIPGPSAAERAQQLAAPLGSFATEDPTAAAQELKTDPRGRLARIDAQRQQLLGGQDVSRETSPLYTDAPRARGSHAIGPGVTPGGNAPDTMPYAGALDGLLGLDVPRAGIRKEFGGTAPDITLSFSDAQGRGPGMRPYSSRSGATKDVGARGGGFGAVHGAADQSPQAALLAQVAGLDELRGEAQRASSTPQEVAQGLVSETPAWDVKAAELGPERVQQELTRWVAEGGDPKVAVTLQRKYAGVADDLKDPDDGTIDLRDWADRLRQGRSPAPGEAETRLKTGGQAVPAAEAQAQQATQAAREPAQDAPGTTRSPAEAAVGGQAATAPPGQPRAPGAGSQVATGGHGKDGIEGLVDDYLSFRNGEGRAGYGESGPMGIAKDAAAFYGARLPQDLIEALLSVGTGRGLQDVGSKLGGLRSVQNALGKF